MMDDKQSKSDPEQQDQGPDELREKPYAFVPFAPEVQRDATAGHQRYLPDRSSGWLSYRLTVETPLFVASGTYALSEELGKAAGEVVRTCYRVSVFDRKSSQWRNLPAIPGSSLKGTTRAIVEAVTASCLTKTGVDVSLLPEQFQWQGQRGRWQNCRPEQACPACALYGSLGRLGNVWFDDAVLEVPEGAHDLTQFHSLPNLFQPHPERGPAYRDESGALQGRKFYFHGRAKPAEGTPAEVIPAGSTLLGSVRFLNLRAEQLGLLAFALGLDGTFQLKLGGAKPACLGSAVSAIVELALLEPDAMLRWQDSVQRLKPPQAEVRLGQLMQQAETNLILSEQVQKLRGILRPDNARQCPTGMY